ncbi:neurexin-4-like [Porites lutea]|uniref:neurexin-4-like n=1 Tax=Porites lutea TaxID=51062 RepID=UPI003CC68E04
MTGKNGVGVTVISHDSESNTHVKGCKGRGCYSRNIHYIGATSLFHLASLTSVSSHCEQFIKYECYGSKLLRSGKGWWVSRDYSNMTYWGGASPGSGKCACGMNNTCANPNYGCNCDANDNVWREDSGLLTDKTKLPVKQLRFGDNGYLDEQGYHTLGKFKCYGTA